MADTQSTEQARVCGTKKWNKYGSGYPDDLSDEQLEVLDDFLSKVPEEHKEAARFPCENDRDIGCRLLRARKFSVNEALTLAKSIKEFGADQLRDTDPEEILGCTEEEIQHHWPQGRLPTFDNENRPVYMEKTGKIDVHGILKITTPEKLLRWHVHSVERCSIAEMGRATRLIRDRDANARAINCNTSILDLEGFSLGSFMGETKAYLNKVSEINQNYYPETMGKMLIINAPTVFTAVWSVVKGWLDPRTVSKIEILGGPNQYRPRLFEVLGKENTPREYGGEYDCPDGPIFETKLTTKKIAAAKQHYVCTPVRASQGESYRVRWWADLKAVDFGVKFVEGVVDSSLKEDQMSSGKDVYPMQAHPDCDNGVVEFRDTPSTDGTYVALWKNTHSVGWVSSNNRHVTYKSLAVKPASSGSRAASSS